ncbi:hypothetical protein RND71_028952 [Anisodus tanguticus]|uniref:Uncharacterized protein n=1 Tax=Anisodus tanguticus TaxID=243964 RepID=A0AAE1RLP0_9SOLA|nr:hypothetical protein RND71_028952 [Anisodus tanguticus]
MHVFSTVDGFVEITESLADMIKFIANEPSAELFCIQQHTQNAVPNLINLNNNIEQKSRQVTLHTADSEDYIIMVRSIKECGFPIVNEMIKDLGHALAIVSEKQPRSRFIKNACVFRNGLLGRHDKVHCKRALNGAFYVNAVPNLIYLTSNIEEKSRKVTLHTADSEDSIIRSMKECGFPIVDEMFKDLGHALAVMSEKQPRSRFISKPSSSFPIGRTISLAKEKASSFKWPQMESIESKPAKNEAALSGKDEQSVTCSNDATLAAYASS